MTSVIRSSNIQIIMNNNIFQFDRFYKLVVKHLKSTPKSWTMIIIVFAGLPLLFLLVNLLNVGVNIDLNSRYGFLTLLMNAAFILSPFVLFYNYNHPKKGLSEVMLPASIVEKYIVMQLACIIFAPLVILLIFGSMDSLLALIFQGKYEGYVVYEFFQNSISWDELFNNFLLQQAILFCNLLFVRRKIMKTAGVFILAGIVIAIIFGVSIAIWDSHQSFTDAEGLSFNFEDRSMFQIYANDHPLIVIIQFTRIFFHVILPLALVTCSYFLMKNKRY